MNIDIITQYVLAIVPAFTAVVGMVVTLGVGIGRIKRANKDTEATMLSISEEVSDLVIENKNLKRENALLKKSLNKITAKLEHMNFVDIDEKE